MAFFKVCCLVLLAATVVISEDSAAATSSVESAGEQDLEGAETVFLAKKLLLLKGLGLGGLLLLSQKGGSGGFDGLASKFGGSTSVEYGAPAPAYGGFSSNYVAAPAPVPAPVPTYASYAAPAPAPAPVATYTSYAAPASGPAPTYTSYVAPAPAPVQVSYQADTPVASGYTGNLQVIGYLSPVQSVRGPAPVAYSNQAVSSGYSYSAPAPAPQPIAASVQPPCEDN
ncbi:hypothetical protein quinque_003599 [Culex quinquefasciatus]|uniref:skin secretory protein xP2-like n=1 Tax=Culex pipiens pallens TaxID=42434 RepID=UPI00195442A9|nr:skin secretory protein xP2-like [Culex pipiens pallens]